MRRPKPATAAHTPVRPKRGAETPAIGQKRIKNPDSAKILARMDNAHQNALPEATVKMLEGSKGFIFGSENLTPKNPAHKVLIVTGKHGISPINFAFEIDPASRMIVKGSK